MEFGKKKMQKISYKTNKMQILYICPQVIYTEWIIIILTIVDCCCSGQSSMPINCLIFSLTKKKKQSKIFFRWIVSQ